MCTGVIFVTSEEKFSESFRDATPFFFHSAMRPAMSQVGAAIDHSRGDPTGMKSNTFVVVRGLGIVCSCSVTESKLTTTEGISEKATCPLPFPRVKT